MKNSLPGALILNVCVIYASMHAMEKSTVTIMCNNDETLALNQKQWQLLSEHSSVVNNLKEDISDQGAIVIPLPINKQTLEHVIDVLDNQSKLQSYDLDHIIDTALATEFLDIDSLKQPLVAILLSYCTNIFPENKETVLAKFTPLERTEIGKFIGMRLQKSIEEILLPYTINRIDSYAKPDLRGTQVMSHDGSKAVVMSEASNRADLWDVPTHSLLHSFAHPSFVVHAQFSSDGLKIATASIDGTVLLWDTINGNVLHTFTHTDLVSDVQFNSDTSRMVTASYDRTAKLWDVTNGSLTYTFGHADKVLTAKFSPDEFKIVTASWDKTAQLWNAINGTLLHTFGHDGWVMTAKFSPDGLQVATASYDKTVKLWDTRTGTLLHTLPHAGGVWDVQFSPDSSKIVTASRDNTAKLWDTTTGNSIHTFVHSGLVIDMQFNLSGTQLMTHSNDGIAQVWELFDTQLNTRIHALTLLQKIELFVLVQQRPISLDHIKNKIHTFESGN